MKTAMTRKEWREFLAAPSKMWPYEISDHAVVARLLYDRPYGFDYDMVLAIRACCRKVDALQETDTQDMIRVLHDAADRIEWLLPEGAE